MAMVEFCPLCGQLVPVEKSDGLRCNRFRDVYLSVHYSELDKLVKCVKSGIWLRAEEKSYVEKI